MADTFLDPDSFDGGVLRFRPDGTVEEHRFDPEEFQVFAETFENVARIGIEGVYIGSTADES